MWRRLTTSITCYKTISKTTTQDTSMGQITSLTLCRLCVWPQLSTAATDDCTTPWTTFYPSSVSLLCEPWILNPSCMIRVALGISPVLCTFTSECFALSSASPTRLLRSLVNFADLCLLGVLWWIYAYPLFLFSIGRSSFIYHPEAENMPRLCG